MPTRIISAETKMRTYIGLVRNVPTARHRPHRRAIGDLPGERGGPGVHTQGLRELRGVPDHLRGHAGADAGGDPAGAEGHGAAVHARGAAPRQPGRRVAGEALGPRRQGLVERRPAQRPRAHARFPRGDVGAGRGSRRRHRCDALERWLLAA